MTLLNIITHLRKRIAGYLCLLIVSQTPHIAHSSNDDLVGFELFTREDFGAAAEVFDDPAWKGAALYRSNQWWRAAEVFVRGNDAASFHNLGNTYVKLGYYALALEAYQQALKIDPGFDDAAFNAQLMRDLLALREREESGQGLLQPDSLGELDQQDDATENTGAPEGGEKSDQASGVREEQSTAGEQTTSERAVEAESGPAAQSDEDDATNDSREKGSSTITGIESESAGEQNAAGNANSMSAAADARAAGVRTELEAEQATEQWLNRIQHNPILYLQRHIELETRRRRAAGQLAPEGGDGW